jgi:hypothetical protein
MPILRRADVEEAMRDDECGGGAPHHLSILAAISLAAILVGCEKKQAAAPDIRPVRTVTVEPGAGAERTTLTGEIRAPV